MSKAAKNPGLTELDELCIQTIRFLSIDGVQEANSGHPGMPMGMAPAAYILWTKYLKFNSANPRWYNRDRFVLSAGHGSMLLYSMLHLCGFEISMDEVKTFRQWGSKTPGHPEFELDHGIEVTTGPLGQGISNAVGMAIAQKYLAKYFNREGFPIIDYKIYVIASDGDLQEGVASEACSLAGHLGLDNLIVVYDDNHISIDGDTNLAFTEDRAMRFESYGWNVQEVGGDGNDMAAFETALDLTSPGKPLLVKLRTHIAFGSPNLQDTSKSHGSPLGEDEIKLIKEKYGWDPNVKFHVPDEVTSHFKSVIEKGKEAEVLWQKLFDSYAGKYPELAEQFDDAVNGRLPLKLDEVMPKFKAGESIATRSASGKVLAAVMPKLPMMMGGSADLTPSNNTGWPDAKDFQRETPDGRYLRFGIREHAMGSILNGISVSGLMRAYGGTFLVFSDYMRGAVRVASIAKYPSIFVWTHDSFGVGEDGPTHQPVEHLASLRVIPNLVVLRPADANEACAAWAVAVERRHGPTALLMSRQNLPTQPGTDVNAMEGVARGAWVLADVENGADPTVVLAASGSEVALAVESQKALAGRGVAARVVSMPSWELFEAQEDSYRRTVFPDGLPVVGIEAGVSYGWHRYIGERGAVVCLDRFGASAPGATVARELGFTVEAVVEKALALI